MDEGFKEGSKEGPKWYFSVSALFNAFQNINKKGQFDNNVEMFKRLLYGEVYDDDRKNLSIYSFDSASAIGMISDWVSSFITELWDFTGEPFKLVHYDEEYIEGDEDYREDTTAFYKHISRRMYKFFADNNTRFKTSFRSFIHDWFTLGVGVMYYTDVGDLFVLKSIAPENCQWRVDEHDRIVEVIIVDYPHHLHAAPYNFTLSSEYSSIQSRSLKKPYIHFKLVSELGSYPEKWEITRFLNDEPVHRTEYDYENHIKENQYLFDNGIIEEDPSLCKEKTHFKHDYTRTVNYTPIFISKFDERSQSNLPYGKGLEVLPLLKEINNINKSLSEALSSALEPTVVVRETFLDAENTKNNPAFQHQTASFLKSVTPVSSAMDSAASPIEPIYIQRDFGAVYSNLARLSNEVTHILSPNGAVQAKGRARMTGTEFEARENYDKIGITEKAASIIDDLLVPLIYQVFDVALNFYEDADLPFKEAGSKARDVTKAVTVKLSNVMGEKNTTKRLTEISTAMNLMAQLKQIKDMGFDTSIISKEVASLLHTQLTEQEQSLDQLDSMLNLATAEDLQTSEQPIDINSVPQENVAY